MSHDLEASWASTQIAKEIESNPGICFTRSATPSTLNAYAGRESKKSKWPYADGVVELNTGSSSLNLAIEYKRPNEGTHGVLTAIGQSHAYIEKGYSGCMIILPDEYTSLKNVGDYVNNVLNNTSNTESIGICTYLPPDSSKLLPFSGKLKIHRNSLVNSSTLISAPSISKIETQWVHVREGSTEPDAFFKYMQAVKFVSGIDSLKPNFKPPLELINAVDRLSPGVDPYNYLSNAPGSSLHDNAWKYFWFNNVLTEQMMIGWKKDSSGIFNVNHTPSELEKIDGTGKKQFFSGRSDSIKNKCVKKLNSSHISENEAWEMLAQNFHNRAHSYREDIDSFLEKIDFLENSGRMTKNGFKFLDTCEKSSNGNSDLSKAILAKAFLNEGGFSSLLHYIHKLSNEKFANNPFEFISTVSGRKTFLQNDYLMWLEDELSKNLKVLKKVSLRGGTPRKPLQAERTLLKQFGLVEGFRFGVGLVVNWPEMQKIMEIN